MMLIQRLPAPPDGGRMATGPVQFGDDWPGVFIRGDNASWYALQLRLLLPRLDPSEQIGLSGLLSALEGSDLTRRTRP